MIFFFSFGGLKIGFGGLKIANLADMEIWTLASLYHAKAAD